MPRILSILAVLPFLLFACGEEPTDERARREIPEMTQDEKMASIAPPPPVCTFLTEAEVLSHFPAEVKIPMPGQRSPLTYNSCQYNLDAPGWNAALVVERPEDVRDRQSIVNQVAGTEGDGLELMGHQARILNDGRILAVASEPPFRVKFSALPKHGFPAAYTAEERRELILKLAGSVLQ